MNEPDQFQLFAADPVPPPDAVTSAPVSADILGLAQHLPSSVQLGTSSWSFPGWAGIVYKGHTSKQLLAQMGLAAYARHPLLRAVGIDRTFYAPVTATSFSDYLDAVPRDFYFVVKAHHRCTSPVTLSFDGRPSGPNRDFLSRSYTLRHVVEPLCEGLGAEQASLLLQFSPMCRHLSIRERLAFPGNLHQLLRALPRELAVTVELRDPELFTPAYLAALEANGASHCINIHPRAAPLAAQLGARPSDGAPTVVRWMLGGELGYQAAKKRYHPFDHLVDPDPQTRATIAERCMAIHRLGGRSVVIANNKAEGSAPLTLIELARHIASHANRQLGS